MTKVPRILANLLLPPGVATVLLVLFAVVFGFRTPRWQEVAFVMLYAYGFAAVPSIIHAVLMERFYRRGLPPTQGRAIIVSSVSGLIAGILLVFILAVSSPIFAASRLWPYPPLGAATGAVVAVFILCISHVRRKNA